MSETRELPPLDATKADLAANEDYRGLHLHIRERQLSEALRERDGLQAKLDGIEGQIRRQERLYNLAFDNQVRAHERADKAERERDEAIANYNTVLDWGVTNIRERDEAREVLEEVDMKAEAGMCQFSSGGKHEFLRDIRKVVAALGLNGGLVPLAPPTKGAPE